MITSNTFEFCRGVFQHVELLQKGVAPEKLRTDFAPASTDWQAAGEAGSEEEEEEI
jgi:hypothetical protein